MKFSETLNAGPSADAMTKALPETLNAGPLQGLAFRVALKPVSLRLLVLFKVSLKPSTLVTLKL